MSQNKEATKLITIAGVIAGSEYKLAKSLGLPQSTLTDWKSGRKACTPPDRARLALFAERDVAQELMKATIEHTAGTVRGEQLSKALEKYLIEPEPKPLAKHSETAANSTTPTADENQH